MSAFSRGTTRRIVPRWRSFHDTLHQQELGTVSKTIKLDQGSDSRLAKKFDEWKAKRTPSFAGELISLATVLGTRKTAEEASAELLRSSKGVTSSLSQLASSTIGRKSPADDQDTARPNESISKLRKMLSVEPRDAIVWVDLAREYLITGDLEKAERAISRAVFLGMENRFVLRSASRFYVHIEEPGKALSILRKSDLAKSDPWLMAAEVAISSIAEKGSRFAKGGRKLIENNSFSPFDSSELSSALAGLEMDWGNLKSARRLYRLSLVKPTENSVAQVEFVSRQMNGLEVESRHLSLPRVYEAKSLKAFNEGDWEVAYACTTRWQFDEAFSSRPALLKSYLAATIREDYKEAIRITEQALKSNPDEPMLLNNLIFSYISDGDVPTALRYFNRIKIDQLAESYKVTISATAGLLSYRLGDSEQGCSLYSKSIELAKKLRDRRSASLATLYHLREQSLAGTIDARRVEKVARDILSKADLDPDIHLVGKRIMKTYAGIEK